MTYPTLVRVLSCLAVLALLEIDVFSQEKQVDSNSKMTAEEATQPEPVELLTKQLPTPPDQSPSEKLDSESTDNSGESSQKSKSVTAKSESKKAPTSVEDSPKSTTETLTDLAQQLAGGGQEGRGNPIEPIIERMRKVQQQLEKTVSSQEVRSDQRKIISDIDALIEALKKSPPPQQNSDQNSSPPPPDGGQGADQKPPPLAGTKQPKPQNSQRQKGQEGSQQKKTATAPSEAEKSRESSEKMKGQKRTAEEEDLRRRLEKDVWGHLPPGLRQQLLNVYSEKFLPKYDDMVRRYYEALAQQESANP